MAWRVGVVRMRKHVPEGFRPRQCPMTHNKKKTMCDVRRLFQPKNRLGQSIAKCVRTNTSTLNRLLPNRLLALVLVYQTIVLGPVYMNLQKVQMTPIHDEARRERQRRTTLLAAGQR